MKKQLILYSLLLSFGCAYSQYKIDLSKRTPVPIEYLKMGSVGEQGEEIRINNLYMEEGGVPQLPVMGEFHYSRMHPEYWRDALLKMKASGVNIVATYCLWSLHEEMEGELSWREHLNLRRFVQLCKELELKVHLRVGPYCNAEIKNGGLPDWIAENGNFRKRSNDPLYLSYVRRWYEAIYHQVEELLYKDGGPIMAVQLENEYVTKGEIIPHLMNLKKIAVETGFDVPLYSMTHWMDSEYPKGEIVPYAGFYIEAAWRTKGKEEMPPSNFEYFTYNRLSDNIGTDIIKIEGDVETLSGEDNDSPFFTCEVGVGATTFYHRRAIVPEEMAGEMINLRLGCGANMMGYYMYVGGSNPVGKRRTFQSSGPRINYDYQAPIREFGTLGEVMKETKKYNYFMNDFGTDLAPAVAYLPTSNQNQDNLQWAVRSKNNSGYLFCSNYLYRHSRKEYKGVQFTVKLEDETIKIPRNKVTVKDGAYFLWPFNQQFGDVLVKYATVQPICHLKREGGVETLFFFEDDQIGGEFLIDGGNVKEVTVDNGQCKKEGKGYFINQLQAGKNCIAKIDKQDGTTLQLVILTEEESDQLWKGTFKGNEFVAISDACLIYDNDAMTLISEQPTAEMWIFKDGEFIHQTFQEKANNIKATIKQLSPMAKADWISPVEGNTIQRTFTMSTFSQIERAYLRYASSSKVIFNINGRSAEVKQLKEYQFADVTELLNTEKNQIEAVLQQPQQGVIAEIEVLMTNGERMTWSSDATWTGHDNKSPVHTVVGRQAPLKYAPEEHLALYEVYASPADKGERETRIYISYEGNVANAYLNGQLIGDSFNNGTEWILSLSRMKESIEVNPLTIRIDGLQSVDAPIYLEKDVDPERWLTPTINKINIIKEHRFTLK